MNTITNYAGTKQNSNNRSSGEGDNGWDADGAVVVLILGE